MESYKQRYPFLSEADWEDCKDDKEEQIRYLNEKNEKKLLKKLENFSLKEKRALPSGKTDELRIVVIGKTGQGKSATTNTILADEVVKEDCSSNSVTSESRRFTRTVNGRIINVVDTPGLQDTSKSNDSICKEIGRITKLYPDGVHAFIYVMNMANPRFTAEDMNVLEVIEKTFGGNFKAYCLLVFTHGDAELQKMNLDSYRIKQLRCKESDVDSGLDVKNFANFLTELDWRMVAIDNRPSTDCEANAYRGTLFNMIDKMRLLNKPEIYTNAMFKQAQEKKEALRKQGLVKGWDPEVMHIVNELISEFPSIKRKSLQQMVDKRLLEEHKKRLREIEAEKKRQQNEFEQKMREYKERKEREEMKLREEERERARQREEEEKEWVKQQAKLKEDLIMQRKEEQERRDRMEKEEAARLEREREERRRLEEEMQARIEKLEMERREQQQELEKQRERAEKEAERRRQEETRRQVNEIAEAEEGFMESMVNGAINLGKRIWNWLTD